MIIERLLDYFRVIIFISYCIKVVYMRNLGVSFEDLELVVKDKYLW